MPNKEIPKSSNKECVTVVGTGNFGTALGRCLMASDYNVVYGSRNPNPDYLKLCFESNLKNYSVKNISDALLETDELAFLAISARDGIYEDLVNEIKTQYQNFYKRTKPLVLVDISNRVDNAFRDSNAEKLDSLVKSHLSGLRISIVKGFNLMSAYSIGQDRFSSKSALTGGLPNAIPICGDDKNAKETLTKLCKRLGYQTNDVGSLKQAGKLENVNTQSFTDWSNPSIISLLFMVFNFIWIAINYFVFPKKPKSIINYIKDFSIISHLNKILGFSALQLLACVYFGSVLASIFQLKNGTKYKLFPKLLDTFLRQRKQYGLWAFLFATTHAILSIFITNPGYLKTWFTKDLDLTFNGEINIITGVLAYTLFLLVALSSINSIANSLNWKEWYLVQTQIGLVCLFFGTVHTLSMYANIYGQKDTDKSVYTTEYLLTRAKLYAIFFPGFVMMARFILGYFPPLSKRLQAIRCGMIDFVVKKE